MNKTLKKGIILSVVYLVVLAAIVFLPGLILNSILANAMAVSGMGRYVEAASLYRSMEQLEPEERNKAFLLRDALSDSLIDHGLMSVEFAYDFYHPTEQLAYSGGSYARVCHPNEEGEVVNPKKNFALVDLKKLSETSAGDALCEFSQQESNLQIRIDEYALDGFECYPLSISLYEHGLLLCSFTLNETLDVSGMEVYTEDDAYMNTISLNEKLAYIRSGSHETRDRIERIKKSCDYSVNQVQEQKKVTPFTATMTVVSTKDGYGFFGVSKLHTEKLMDKVIIGGLAWTVIMGLIILIAIAVGNKR